MSWEVMQTETGLCACGAGTETYTLEMDDWNRTRSATEIHCPGCREKQQQELAADKRREERRGLATAKSPGVGNGTIPRSLVKPLRQHDKEGSLAEIYRWCGVSSTRNVLPTHQTRRESQQTFGMVPNE